MTCGDYETKPWDWADWKAAQSLCDTFDDYGVDVIRKMRPCWVQHIARVIRESWQDGKAGVVPECPVEGQDET
jgi:hypothetical protein